MNNNSNNSDENDMNDISNKILLIELNKYKKEYNKVQSEKQLLQLRNYLQLKGVFKYYLAMQMI